ncbi:2734_t:CDS:1 [Ambispora leptoticha]|uniref:2734_t:CDS:1 n=1 Tax=Ambispora leptoticha TaxID=144679 RepID=A0A9N9EVZ1_9GLOM|nr:2734_t:CDS:1 [Ambispora leptoticha]
MDKITKFYTNLTKHKAGFASTIPSSTLFYNRIYSLKIMQNTQQLQLINNFSKILNHPSFGTFALKIRLQQLQNSATTNHSILMHQPILPSPENKTTTVQIILKLHKVQLILHNDSNIWPIPMNQIGTSINSILYSNLKASVIKGKLNTHHIYFIEQLTNSSHTQLLTWQESHHNTQKIPRGRQPKWYNTLLNDIAAAENIHNQLIQPNSFTIPPINN